VADLLSRLPAPLGTVADSPEAHSELMTLLASGRAWVVDGIVWSRPVGGLSELLDENERRLQRLLHENARLRALLPAGGVPQVRGS
jgi:hypothetical protein